jgi:CheY-like chemotaxis protein
MSEEIRSRCLEPFFSTKGERGTGLGLSMVFGIVKRHNGQLDLQSEMGKGTTFSICLPLGGVEIVSVEEAPAVTRPMRILLAEDEVVSRDVVSRFLRMDGHEVEIVENGFDALHAFEQQSFDLVLTDHGMPGMNGLQLAAAVKELQPNVPIILLTGFGHPGLRNGETPDCVDIVISKPVPQNALRKAIAGALSAAKERDSRPAEDRPEASFTMAA